MTDFVLKAHGNPGGDFTPALYYLFPASLTDVWVRLTCRSDVPSASETSQPLVVLGFDQWATDQAYYGDWWRLGGLIGNALTPDQQSPFGYRPTIGPWEQGEDTGATVTDVSEDPGYTAGAHTYDFRMTFTGTTVDGSGHTHSHFNGEAWVHDTQMFKRTTAFQIDAGKTPYGGCQAIMIPNRYGTNGNIYLDDIMVGTTRGGSDILAVQGFQDQTFGDLVLDDGDGLAGDLSLYYSIVDATTGLPPAAGPRHIWRAV